MKLLPFFCLVWLLVSCTRAIQQTSKPIVNQDHFELKDSPLMPNYYASDPNPYAFYESAAKFIDAVNQKEGYWSKTTQASVYARRFVEKQKDDAEVVQLMKWLPDYISWEVWRQLYINKVSAAVRAQFDTVQLKKEWSRTEFTYRDNVLKRGVNGELVASGKKWIDETIEWEKQVEEEGLFVTYEVMPEYPEGEDALMTYIKDNVKLPECVLDGRVQGKSVIDFVVEVDGELEEFRIVRSLNKECDDEAIRVLKTMPRWKPGKMRGKPIRTRYTIPVVFKRQE